MCVLLGLLDQAGGLRQDFHYFIELIEMIIFYSVTLNAFTIE